MSNSIEHISDDRLETHRYVYLLFLKAQRAYGTSEHSISVGSDFQIEYEEDVNRIVEWARKHLGAQDVMLVSWQALRPGRRPVAREESGGLSKADAILSGYLKRDGTNAKSAAKHFAGLLAAATIVDVAERERFYDEINALARDGGWGGGEV